jgi:ATP-dependent DNA helicase RecG
MVKHTDRFADIRGIGPRFTEKFEKLGIYTVNDLIRHFPARYEDWSDIVSIEDIEVGDAKTIQGVVSDVSIERTWKKRMTIVKATITDDTDSIQAIWFNQPYIKRTLKEGVVANFAGKVADSGKGAYLSNPTYEVFPYQKELSKEVQTKHTGRLVPIYPETKGLTSKGIRFLLQPILKQMEPLKEYIPTDILEKYDLLEINAAMRAIHFPENMEQTEQARRRFAFEELFFLQLKTFSQKIALTRSRAPRILMTRKELTALAKELPFTLTGAQDRSVKEIADDLKRAYPMNRLLQGDVGSGKTIVVGLVAILAAQKGHQVAFMAPTEILAKQHYETVKKFFGSFEGGVALLCGKESRVFYGEGLETEKKKPDIKKDIESGAIGIVIGTHALLQKTVVFDALGLVIIDEQHRFGVKQRAELIHANGGDDGREKSLPHFLSMSATPIPRTVMMTLFGDLDVSFIDELPKGRKEIITRIVAPKNRENAYAFIRGQVRKGRQVFVVCPRIEPSEEQKNEASRIVRQRTLLNLQVTSVKEEYERLSNEVFPDMKVGLLHGKLKAAEKASVMEAFSKGAIDVLVSTSVIEVGVDVPNATIMVIEGADRFGLAQLYQFRGRVGRGDKQSFCLLFTDSTSKSTETRLQSLISARNGFELAEKDLRLRGPGEFLGKEQAGMPDIAMRALKDRELITIARTEAEAIIKADTSLKEHPDIRERLRAFSESVHFE